MILTYGTRGSFKLNYDGFQPLLSRIVNECLYNNQQSSKSSAMVGTSPNPPVEEPPNTPKKPPVREPGKTPDEPSPPIHPPVQEPPNEPIKPPLKDPPYHDPNRIPSTQTEYNKLRAIKLATILSE
jgi:hypothetical protein